MFEIIVLATSEIHSKFKEKELEHEWINKNYIIKD